MTTHWRAKVGATAFALAAALFVSSPSYGFWDVIFGYPHHRGTYGHYDSCCDPDYGYIYRHHNTHDEPFFHEETGSEHYAMFHDRGRWESCQEKVPCWDREERCCHWHHDDRCCHVHWDHDCRDDD